MEGLLSFVLNFATSIAVPFYFKEFGRFSRFPVFNAMVVNFVSMAVSFAMAYSARGIPSLFSWIIPNSKSDVYMMMAAMFYAVTCVMTFVCYSYSGVEFTTVFSLFALVMESVLAMTFGDSVIPGNCIVAFIVIMLGLIIMCSDFAWDTGVADASAQILAQCVLWSAKAMYSYCYSRLRSFVAAYETLPASVLNTWIHGTAMIPLCIVFLAAEARYLKDINRLIGVDFVTLMLFGAASRELLAVSGDVMSDIPGYGWTEYAVQLKCLPILLISHIFHNETKFVPSQGIGITLVIFGYVFYSLSAERVKRPNEIVSDGDTVSLLNNEMTEGEAFMATKE